MELDNILDELDDVLSSAGSIPVLNYKLVKASDVDMILEKLRGAVPLEIKRAHDLLEEQKDIKEKAHAEADQIIEQARAEADRLVRQEEVVKAAEDKANSIIATAQQYDRDMRAAADAYADKLHSESMQYAMDVFNYLEENLNKTLTAVRDNGQALRSSYESDNQIESGDRK